VLAKLRETKLTGTVRRSNGRIVPSAKVTLIDRQTATATDGQTRRSVHLQSVEAELTPAAEGEGFSEWWFVVVSEKPLNIKIKLKIATEENVTVSDRVGSRRIRFKCKRRKMNDNFCVAPDEVKTCKPC